MIHSPFDVVWYLMYSVLAFRFPDLSGSPSSASLKSYYLLCTDRKNTAIDVGNAYSLEFQSSRSPTGSALLTTILTFRSSQFL